jgi:hypothetical protein
MAYEKEIIKNSTDSHQTSPAAVITVLQWAPRKPSIPGINNISYTNEEGVSTRPVPFAIHSDILNVSCSNTKSQLSPTFTATLVMGDINYTTAIHPGDFVFLNIVNWQTQAVDIAKRAIALEPINDIEDGFCGVYKIQTVRKTLSVDSNGSKTYQCQIAGAGFTEFNNIISFNPAIADAFKKEAQDLSQFYLGDFFSQKLKQNSSIQEMIQDLLVVLIGQSLKEDAKVENYGNKHFKMPDGVGKLLGIEGISYASEMYNYIVGVWANKSSSDGFFPGFSTGVGDSRGNSNVNNFFPTDIPLQGDILIGLDDWNNSTAWSIIQQYINSAMNEIYTCYRLSPTNNNKVLPTVVIRQKPFTSPEFVESDGIPVTKFMDLPRWVLNPDLVYSATLGFEEAARINFVQCFTRRMAGTAPTDHTLQISLGNFFYDTADIQRNGLKPYTISSNFDFPTKGKEELRAKPWARINADWIIGTHLKSAGNIECVGIEDPICVGDNLSFDNTIYHIESITKNLYLAMDGKNRFTTSFKVSYGIEKSSTSKKTEYPEMTNQDSQTNREQDYNKGSKILPGFSDTEDIDPRNKNSGGEKMAKNSSEGFN